ncbi:IRS4 [Candida pseudojiufengensis]|uniref:IRS4 n=1 Tax=Candida pseudojiufengensis TaxID=497109 RepID=UPI0022257EA4|nr:IRS4 [Candida pseudojiufengensis]KAI5961598.1 IRS4 [Candida pseudojiufengensis]
MAASNTAANAAALAAFNAGKKKDDSNLNTTNNQLPKQNKLRTTNSYHNSRVGTPNSIAHKKYGNYASDISSSPASALSPSAWDYPVRNSNSSSDVDQNQQQQQQQQQQPQSQQDYFALSPHNNSRSDIFKQPRHSPHTPKDMINSVKNSIDSKAIVNDANSKRLSLDYSPQEMLKNLKTTLNNKSKAQKQPRTLDQKGQTFINDMRDKIDNTMKSASNNMENLTLSPALDFDSPIDIKINRSLNGSYSSFESQLDRKSIDRKNEPIRNFSLESQEPIVNHDINIDITDHDDDLNATSTTRITPSGQDIIIPVKLHDNDKQSLSSKTRRKPPPPSSDTEYPSDSDMDYLSGGENEELRNKMMLNAKSGDTFSSGEFLPLADDIISLTDNDEIEQDQEQPKFEGSKFPQFPDLKKHHHHHHIHNDKHLFRKKNREGIAYTPNENISDEELEKHNQNQKLLHSQTYPPPVQFKKTMRKTNKRKEKKSKFDEYKPWKNHNELNYLTDSEKKRYEGVWVSNKGNYMNFLVTKLNGVDYNALEDPNKVSFVHQEDSMKAALISTNTVSKDQQEKPTNQSENNSKSKTTQTKEEEMNDKLHHLNHAEINQLISGCVVKRIWNRSRLPDDILEQVWNLVDFRRDGSLNKNEFLVGMWLVDQCLYGRKLPKKLDSIVWESLGGIGVNVNLKKMK